MVVKNISFERSFCSAVSNDNRQQSHSQESLSATAGQHGTEGAARQA